MILTDEEIKQIHFNLCNTVGSDYKTVSRAIEAAIMAKLASAELPEPELMPMLVIGVKHSSENVGERSFTEAEFYSAACEIFKLGQAQAYAQGAAAQLAEPIYQYKRGDDSWVDQTKTSYDYNAKHGASQVRIVYTRREA